MVENKESPKPLPGYDKLLHELETAIHHAKYTGTQVGVLYIFASLGQFSAEKDKASQTELTEKLSKIVDENICLFHLKENQFCFIVQRVTETKEMALYAKTLISLFNKPYTIKIGIAIFPMAGMLANELLDNAKMAADKCLQQHLSSYHYFKPDVQASADRLIAIENELPYALIQNELRLHYQAQINLKTSQLVGVEALARWHHPTLAWVRPDEFIPVAEKSGFIFDLGKWVIQTACMQYKDWALPKPFRLAINVSPKQLASYYIVDTITMLLKKIDFDPACLELEITENELIHDIEEHKRKLMALTKMGIKIAIDDYGTGYSTLHYLKNLPIHGLKIDKNFIDLLSSDETSSVIVKSTIKMAHKLGLRVIAEGVETKEQLKDLLKLGCDEGQGYLFSKPLANAEFMTFLKNKTANSSY